MNDTRVTVRFEPSELEQLDRLVIAAAKEQSGWQPIRKRASRSSVLLKLVSDAAARLSDVRPLVGRSGRPRTVSDAAAAGSSDRLPATRPKNGRSGSRGGSH